MTKHKIQLQEEAEALLQQALKQPGVDLVIDICDTWNKIEQDYDSSNLEVYMPKVTYGNSTNGITD